MSGGIEFAIGNMNMIHTIINMASPEEEIGTHFEALKNMGRNYYNPLQWTLHISIQMVSTKKICDYETREQRDVSGYVFSCVRNSGVQR